MKPSCKHLSLLLPIWVLSTSHTAASAQKVQAISVPALSVAVLPKVKKCCSCKITEKFVFICCSSWDLRTPHSSRSFLFDFGQAVFICTMFGLSYVWRIIIFSYLLGQVSEALLLNNPCQYLHRNAQYLLELGQGLNSFLIWCNEFQQLIMCWVKMYSASEVSTGGGCEVTLLGLHFRAFVHLPVEP